MREMSKSNTYNRVANNLETIVFKKFTDKNNDGIGNLEIKCSDNSDGESIKLIATRLLKERAQRRVLFIISDNKPYLSEADIPTMDKDLHDTLKWCIQNRVELYAFGFNEGGELFYKQNYCHVKTYDDFLKFCHQKILAK
jgi:cobalamin biosynthesis protein CobT